MPDRTRSPGRHPGSAGGRSGRPYRFRPPPRSFAVDVDRASPAIGRPGSLLVSRPTEDRQVHRSTSAHQSSHLALGRVWLWPYGGLARVSEHGDSRGSASRVRALWPVKPRGLLESRGVLVSQIDSPRRHRRRERCGHDVGRRFRPVFVAPPGRPPGANGRSTPMPPDAHNRRMLTSRLPIRHMASPPAHRSAIEPGRGTHHARTHLHVGR